MIYGHLRSQSESSGLDHLIIARTTTILERLRGLLGRAGWLKERGLWIIPCNSIHTLFMTCAIDAIFMDQKGKVLKICPGLKPWRFAACLRAASVLEISAGQSASLGISEGRIYQWVETDDQ